MSKKDIIDYVMETPGNTNKKVLGRLIDEVEGVKLPEVTEDDNGNVLTVVEGVWDKAEPNGGSGGGVFMVEMGPKEDTPTTIELKATWQEIYDAFTSGKLVVAHRYQALPMPDAFIHACVIIDMVSYAPGVPGDLPPYQVQSDGVVLYSEAPDERPNDHPNDSEEQSDEEE